MEKNRGFAFYENFWTSIEKLPIEQQKDICYAVVKYGITGEMVDATDNALGFAMTQAFKPAIDNSVERFNSNSENGTKGGRPVKIVKEELIEVLRGNPKITAKEVAEKLGVSESAIQKREEWKNRKSLTFAKSIGNADFNF